MGRTGSISDDPKDKSVQNQNVGNDSTRTINDFWEEEMAGSYSSMLWKGFPVSWKHVVTTRFRVLFFGKNLILVPSL